MPRDYANIQVSIWGHPDVRALPPLQQWLYLQLWTHPDLSYAGVIDWRPGRLIAPLSQGSTAESINAILPLLIERRFVVLDEATEEMFLRSYFRHDGLLKQRTLAVSMVNAYSATGSNIIRAAVVLELLRLRDEFPDWLAWSSPKVLAILKHPAADPPLHPAAEGGAKGEAESRAEGSPTDTDTSTDTASPAKPGAGGKKPAVRLHAEWAPTASQFDRVKGTGIDIVKEAEAFRLHAETNDRHVANWNAAFTMWLSKAKPSTPPRRGSDSWMQKPAEPWMPPSMRAKS